MQSHTSLMRYPIALSSPLRCALRCAPPCWGARCLSSSASLLSGHSKWATIKHDKGKNDKAKSQARTLLTKDITNAVKRELSTKRGA